MNTKRFIQIGLVLLGMLGFQQVSYAVGTSAGTSIDNTATLDYTVGGVNQTDIVSPAASFVVDNRVNVVVTEVGSALTAGAPGEGLLVTIFDVANQGNEDQGYTFTASNVTSGATLFTKTDAFDVTIDRIAVDLDSSGTVNGAEAWVVAATTDLLTLAENGSVQVLVESTIPLTAQNDQAGLVDLLAVTNNAGTTVATTATAGADTPGAVDVVFGDAAGTAGGDAASDGQHSDRTGYLAESAQLSVGKTSGVIRDPISLAVNPKAIPGAWIRYSITIQNADTAADAAVLTTITDALVAQLAFDPDHDGSDGNPASLAGSGIRVFTGDTGGCVAAGTTPRNTAIDSYFTTTNADADGASHNGINPGGTVSVDFSLVLPADGVSGHAAGELRACENVTITFNAIVE